MAHLLEHPHAFIKDNRVINVAIFAEHDAELIKKVAMDCGAFETVCCCDYESVPTIHSSWNGALFEPPTLEYLFSIGVCSELPFEE